MPFSSVASLLNVDQLLKERICSFQSKFFLFKCRPSLKEFLHQWMVGWMTCDFTSFLTVFQSYQNDIERLCAL